MNFLINNHGNSLLPKALPKPQDSCWTTFVSYFSCGDPSQAKVAEDFHESKHDYFAYNSMDSKDDEFTKSASAASTPSSAKLRQMTLTYSLIPYEVISNAPAYRNSLFGGDSDVFRSTDWIPEMHAYGDHWPTQELERVFKEGLLCWIIYAHTGIKVMWLTMSIKTNFGDFIRDPDSCNRRDFILKGGTKTSQKLADCLKNVNQKYSEFVPSDLLELPTAIQFQCFKKTVECLFDILNNVKNLCLLGALYQKMKVQEEKKLLNAEGIKQLDYITNILFNWVGEILHLIHKEIQECNYPDAYCVLSKSAKFIEDLKQQPLPIFMDLLAENLEYQALNQVNFNAVGVDLSELTHIRITELIEKQLEAPGLFSKDFKSLF